MPEVVHRSTSGGSFLGKAGPLVLARFGTAVLSVAIPLVLARGLSLTDYGTYKQIFLLFGTIYYVLPFGMTQGLYFFLPRTKEQRPYLAQVLGYTWVVGALAGCAIFLFGGDVARLFSNPELAHYRLELAIYVACLLGSGPLEATFTSNGRTRISGICFVVSDIARALALTVPVLCGYGLTGAMVAAAGFAVCRWVITGIVLLPRSKGPWFSWPILKSQLVYALPFGLAMAIATPQQWLHQYVVSSMVSPGLFAIYAVGCFQLPVIRLLYAPTSEVLMVRLGELEAGSRIDECLAAFHEAVEKLALIFLPSAAFLFAVAPAFIGAFFGTKYLAAVPIFRVSLVGVVLSTLPVDGVLRARNHTRHILLAYAVKAAVTLPLVLIGVRRFGMLGGIGSWAIAECVGKALLLAKVPRALAGTRGAVRFRQLLPWRALGKATGAAALAMVGVFFVRALTAGIWKGPGASGVADVVPLAIASAVFGAAYLGSLSVLGIRPLAILASLRRRPAKGA